MRWIRPTLTAVRMGDWLVKQHDRVGLEPAESLAPIRHLDPIILRVDKAQLRAVVRGEGALRFREWSESRHGIARGHHHGLFVEAMIECQAQRAAGEQCNDT